MVKLEAVKSAAVEWVLREALLARPRQRHVRGLQARRTTRRTPPTRCRLKDLHPQVLTTALSRADQTYWTSTGDIAVSVQFSMCREHHQVPPLCTTIDSTPRSPARVIGARWCSRTAPAPPGHWQRSGPDRPTGQAEPTLRPRRSSGHVRGLQVVADPRNLVGRATSRARCTHRRRSRPLAAASDHDHASTTDAPFHVPVSEPAR